tara:strand:- start:2425 stop:2763 length:339 start_codon:yes stop_codon:yes gene_type:complete
MNNIYIRLKKVDWDLVIIVLVVVGMWNPLIPIFISENPDNFNGILYYLLGKNTLIIPYANISLDLCFTLISFGLWLYNTEPEGAFLSLVFIYAIPLMILFIYALTFGENGVF